MSVNTSQIQNVKPTFNKISLSMSGIVLIVFLLWSLWLSHQYPEFQFGFISFAGALFGIVLQRSRFCFYCIFTDYFEQRDAKGILGLLVALIVGTLGYHAVFGAFLPQLDGTQLPPDAHIGAVSWILPFSALVFGLGMAFAGSCISAQLYRLGEGLATAPFALLGVLIGFGVGFITWNPLYLWSIQESKAIWLPNVLGYAGSLLLQVVVLGALTIWALWKIQNSNENERILKDKTNVFSQIFQQRWSTWIGGVFVGLIATVAYFRVGALGVTAELGSLARTSLSHFYDVSRLDGLDRLTGCLTVIKETVLSNNGVFIISLVVGSLISALIAGQFKFNFQGWKPSIRIFLGGILMGWGAMISLGCTVGVFLSGIMAGALSGWVFALFCVLGAWIGWFLRTRYI